MSTTSNNPGGQPRDGSQPAFGTGAGSDASGTTGAGASGTGSPSGAGSSGSGNPGGADAGSGAGSTGGSGRGSGAGDGSSGRGEHLKQEARDLADEAREQGKARAGQARDAAADNLDTLADGARAAAAELEDDDAAMLSHYVAEAAERMGELSGSLRDKSVDELMGDLTRFARQQPAMFLSASVAVGFGLARFARASGSRRTAAGSNGDDVAAQDRRSGSRSPRAESTRAATSAGPVVPGAGGYPGAGRPQPAPTGASPASSATPGAASHNPGGHR